MPLFSSGFSSCAGSLCGDRCVAREKVVRELVIAGEFDPEGKVDVATKTQNMEDSMATFTVTNFPGYLHLGSLDIVGLRYIRQDAQSDGSGPSPSSSLGVGNSPAH